MPHRLLADTKKGQLTQVDCTSGNTRRSWFPQQPCGSPMGICLPRFHGCGFPVILSSPSCASPTAPWVRVSCNSVSPFVRVFCGPLGADFP